MVNYLLLKYRAEHLGKQLKLGFTAVAGEGYFINTTSGAIEMDLPAGNIGDEISLYRLCRNI